MRTSYAIALGSNQRHPLHGSPAQVIAAAIAALAPVVASRTIQSRPIGPSLRSYANAAAILESELSPPEMLAHLKSIERAFGRRAQGQKWRARTLDLDIILWSGGSWASPGLTVPHVEFRKRAFVLKPLASIAPAWRDPMTGRTIRQLAYRVLA